MIETVCVITSASFENMFPDVTPVAKIKLQSDSDGAAAIIHLRKSLLI